MRINLIANAQRPDAVKAAREASSWLKKKEVQVGAEHELAKVLGLPEVPPESIADSDLVIAFGGDGTLIRAADLCAAKGTAILGVYYGRFGFVTQCRSNEVLPCLGEFLDGHGRFEERMMLQTELVRGGNTVASLHCLNETVLQRATTTRMLVFSVEVDGLPLTSYPADGVLVSTATGSTAYNLSVGGPILDPRVEALVISAIAPHTLSARPLVLSPQSKLVLRVQSEGDSVLSADGQTRLHLLSGDEVHITRSPRKTKLLMVDTYDFLQKLGEKLLWSQGLT